MKVAITGYVDDHPYHFNETNLMVYSGRNLAENFHFVIFAHPRVADLIKPAHNLTVIIYDRDWDEYYKEYSFAKSLAFVHEHRDILSQYDYIIKTDTDVIFTDKLNSYVFTNKIVVGYGIQFVNQNQPKMAKELTIMAKEKLNKQNYKYLGPIWSTTIGPAKDIIDIFKEADDLCKHIYQDILIDVGNWDDGLYKYVSSMYATEIVICSNYTEDQILIDYRFDAPSSSSLINNPLPWYEYFHFHCMHPEKEYSKFKARTGFYDDKPYLDGDSISAYCVNTYIDCYKDGLIRENWFVD